MFLTRVSGTRLYRLAPEPGEPTVILDAARRILAETHMASAVYNNVEIDGTLTFDFVVSSELPPPQAVRQIIAVS